MENIFSNLPDKLDEESFESLINNANIKLERIVSQGHTTPPNTWLESEMDEWVILLAGHAKVLFKEDGICYDMNPGDHLLIKSGIKHRVEWTDPKDKSIWLALYMMNDPQS